MERGATPRILFVNAYGMWGGSERYLDALLRHLGPRWIDLIVCLQEGPFPTALEAEGYPVEVIPTTASKMSMAVTVWKLRRVVRDRQPDVVHANGIKAALIAGVACLGTGAPVIWVKHDFYWDGFLARVAAALSRRVVGVSHAVTSCFEDRSRSKITVVHNGIRPTLADTAAGRRRLGALGGGNGRSICLVGRIHPVKGHLELIEIAPRLIEVAADLKIVFIGGSDPNTRWYTDEIEERAKELGVREMIVFAGHQDDVLDLISACDLLAITTGLDERGMGREGCPLVALEAMMAGTAMVAYADGGVPEVIGNAGALVTPGDREALAAEMIRLLGDDDARAKFATAAKRRVVENFSLDLMVEKMESIYRESAR